MLRFLARFALVVVGCVMLAGQCLAHASLVASDPAEGSVVATAPSAVRLSFNEPVTPLAFRLFYPTGESIDVTPTAQDSDLVVDLPAGHSEGTYALSWRVASADGHPIGGTTTFSIGHASRRAAAENGMPEATALVIWLARIGVYVGWIGGVGGVFFLTVVSAGKGPVVADRAITGLLVTGAVATIISFGLQGLDELGKGLADVGGATAWKAGLQSRYGETLGLGAVALLLVGIALRLPLRSAAATAASVGLVVIAFALTLSGHASTAAPVWIARPALALHGAMAIIWGGSLLPLLILLATRHETAGRTAVRLSGLLLPTVAVLALTGLMLAYLQQVTIAGLTGTAYGRLLAGKLVFVLCMLAIGALNRRILVPTATSGGDAPSRWLRRLLTVDVCLLLAVLAVVAGWRFTPPPRSIAASETALRHRQMLHIHTAKGMAMIQLADQGGLDIRLIGSNGRPLVAQDVRVSLANPSAGIEPLQRKAARVEDGHWRVDGLTFPVGGAWTVRLNVLISDFESLPLEGTLTVP